MKLRDVWNKALSEIHRGVSPDAFLLELGWRRLSNGVSCFAWRSNCGRFVFKCTGDGRPMHSVLSESYLFRHPELSRHYLRPLFRDHMACMQPYACTARKPEAMALRTFILGRTGKCFDTNHRNCGWFRGRLVNFDPHPDY